LSVLDNPYLGKLAVLPTLHEKETVIDPVFHSLLGIDVRVAKINTDQFGTFAGEVPRTLSQLEAALAKARLAIASTGVPLAIASEGTIGPNPLIPIVSSDLETMVFVDDEKGIVIHESYRSAEITAVREIFRPRDSLDDFLAKADFPTHALIVRSEQVDQVQAVKGIRDKDRLINAVKELASFAGAVVVESDLRASYSPSRMKNIAECARLLALRIASKCPRCNMPGWGLVEPIFGLPCEDCGELVQQAVSADQFGCGSCEYQEVSPRAEKSAQARFCDSCNP
jgi:hypothetical protein